MYDDLINKSNLISTLKFEKIIFLLQDIPKIPNDDSLCPRRSKIFTAFKILHSNVK